MALLMALIITLATSAASRCRGGSKRETRGSRGIRAGSLAKAESFAATQAAKGLTALQKAAGAAGGLECRHGPEDRNGCGDWVAKAEAAAVLQACRSKGGG